MPYSSSDGAYVGLPTASNKPALFSVGKRLQLVTAFLIPPLTTSGGMHPEANRLALATKDGLDLVGEDAEVLASLEVRTGDALKQWRSIDPSGEHLLLTSVNRHEEGKSAYVARLFCDSLKEGTQLIQTE
jgi:hypothetical protein